MMECSLASTLGREVRGKGGGGSGEGGGKAMGAGSDGKGGKGGWGVRGDRIRASVGKEGREGVDRALMNSTQQQCSRNAAQQHYLHQEKMASLSDKPSPCTT